MVTIKDVSKASGYSISTVSYALAGNKKIPIETQKKIKEIADKLGYVPNVYAQGLKNKHPRTIGVYLPGFKGPVHPTILSGIADTIIKNGNEYKLIVGMARMGYDMIYDGLIDVAFIMSPVISDEEVLKISKNCPVILYDKEVIAKNVYNTYIENNNGIYKRVIDFYNKAARTFVFISGSAMSKHNSERLEGFKKAINDCNLKLEDQYILDGIGYTEHHGYDVMKEFLKQNVKIDAIIASNDELAIGAISALKENNKDCLNYILISGFDNIDKGKYITPSLSTIAIDWFEYGNKVGNLAMDILKGENNNKYINVETKLIDRDTGKLNY